METDEPLRGEDVLSTPSRSRKKMAWFAGGCCLLLAIAAGLVWLKLSRPKPAAQKTNTHIATTVSAASRSTFHAAKTFAFGEQDGETDAKSDPPDKPDTPKAAPPPPAADKPRRTPVKKTVFLDKSRPSGAQGGSALPGGGFSGLSGTLEPSIAQAASHLSGLASQPEASGLARQLTASQTKTALAGVLLNRDYLLAKGAYIDCVLNTRLNSTVAGMTKCTLTRNIYSDNGVTLLLERGSEVTGEYRANVAQGQSRLFVLWDRIKTPRGVVINLDSPATDSLGTGGMDGQVDNHFWQRFGGAMMLSLVDDLATYAATRAGENAENYESSSDAAQTMAAEALKHTINIPPTLTKNQGERVGILVARDLDFSKVYQLETKS